VPQCEIGSWDVSSGETLKGTRLSDQAAGINPLDARVGHSSKIENSQRKLDTIETDQALNEGLMRRDRIGRAGLTP